MFIKVKHLIVTWNDVIQNNIDFSRWSDTFANDNIAIVLLCYMSYARLAITSNDVHNVYSFQIALNIKFILYYF